MSGTIDRAGAKVTRAKQRIQEFQLALEAFHDSKPHAVAAREDVQSGKRIYYVSKADPVPDSLAAIAADVIQNLTDAIDATGPHESGKGHSLWQLDELHKRGKNLRLVATRSSYSSVDISGTFSIVPPDAPPLEGLEFPPLYLKPAGKLFSMKVSDEIYFEPIELEVHKTRRFSFDVSFDAPGIVDYEPALKTLQDMTDLVDETVARRGRLLP